jgi:hypothetical protein
LKVEDDGNFVRTGILVMRIAFISFGETAVVSKSLESFELLLVRLSR